MASGGWSIETAINTRIAGMSKLYSIWPTFCFITDQAELKLSQQPVLNEAEGVVQAVQPPDYLIDPFSLLFFP